MERLDEGVSAAIAGEHPSGPIAAVCGRGQPQDEQSRSPVAEAGQRLAPVVPVPVGLALLARHLLAPLNQTRAAAAGDDLALECLPRPVGRSALVVSHRSQLPGSPNLSVYHVLLHPRIEADPRPMQMAGPSANCAWRGPAGLRPLSGV